MNRRLLRAFTFATATLLSIFALEAQTTWTYQGCWSPYPNCAGAADVYRDAAGNSYECGRCGTHNPSSSTCHLANLSGGYWCS
jgi:hypothetical protein